MEFEVLFLESLGISRIYPFIFIKNVLSVCNPDFKSFSIRTLLSEFSELIPASPGTLNLHFSPPLPVLGAPFFLPLKRKALPKQADDADQ